MSIIQISKIQQRSGNLVDLPQLDEAEFGWATDAKLLYIGKTTPNENIEVLTSYSTISFSQINGSGGNLNITAAVDGQVLTYDGTNWVNRGGAAGGLIDLGTVANVKIDGGSVGYVLETDGTGNLSWTPKTAIVAYISDVTQANPGVVTTTTDSYFTSGSLITITDVNGMTELNGNSYYAKVLTSNTFSLYSDSALTVTVDTTGYGAYTSNGRAISSISGGGGGGGAAGGSNTTVQFNNAGVLDGSSSVTWNLATNLFSINGNANVGNLNSNGIVTSTRFTSNTTTGTAPLTVSSTTRVSNLNVAYANVSDFGVVTTQTTGTFYPTFVSGNTTANYALSSNANLSFNAATGTLTTTALNVAGNTANTVTTVLTRGADNNFQLTARNGTASFASGTEVSRIGLNYSGTGWDSYTAYFRGTGAQDGWQILYGGNTAIANINQGGLGITGNISASGNITAPRLISNVSTGTAPLTVSSTTRVSNLSVAYANVSDFTVVTAQTTGTYYPVFVNGTSTANYALASNSGISVNLSNGAITATTFVGNVSGTIVAPGSNTQVIFNDNGSSNATSGLTFDKTSNTLSIANVSSVTSINGGQLAGLRNKIINGSFDYWQRNTSGAVSSGSSGYVAADRWFVSCTSGLSCTFSRVTTTVGSETTYGNYYASAAFTGTGSSGSYLSQRIENVRQFSGKTITVSFYASDTVATGMVVTARQNFGTGGSPSANVDVSSSSITISSSFGNKLTATLSLASITGKTLGTDGNDYLEIFFTPTIANAHTFRLAMVQVEYGSTASAFEQRPPGMELALCQRYYEKSYNIDTTPGTASAFNLGAVFIQRTAYPYISDQYSVTYKVTKRTNPTVTLYSPADGASGVIRDQSINTNVAATSSYSSPNILSIAWTTGTTATPYAFNFTSSAEL